MGHFGVYHVIKRECEAGHSTENYATETPQVFLSLNAHDVALAQEVSDNGIVMLTDYFSHFIPRRNTGNHANGTTPLHTLEDIPCSERLCQENAPITQISTLWPQVLNIISDSSCDSATQTKKRVQFQNSFTIPDADGTEITYELVGRVIHRTEHFTSQLRFGGKTFVYDDIKCASLVESDDPDLLVRPDTGCTYYVYHRKSEKAQVSLFSF